MDIKIKTSSIRNEFLNLKKISINTSSLFMIASYNLYKYFLLFINLLKHNIVDYSSHKYLNLSCYLKKSVKFCMMYFVSILPFFIRQSFQKNA